MGFRSTFITEINLGEWPDWLKEKYKESINFNDCLSSKKESKLYFTWEDLPSDIQKSINWEDRCHPSFTLLWLHECAGITRVHIYKDKIIYDEPCEHVNVEDPTHGDQCGHPCDNTW